MAGILVNALVLTSCVFLLVRSNPVNRTWTSMIGRYWNLLEAFQTLIDEEKGTSKTTNAGIPLRNRADMVNAHFERPRHCADYFSNGYQYSGVYTIKLEGHTPLKVWCDMDRRSGGWTVFQRRINGQVDFYRGWLEYRTGFGNVGGEHWLGLDNIYSLTHSSPMELLIYLEDFEGNSRYAHYSSFAISSEFDKFRLDIGSYTGSAGDAMTTEHQNQQFTTKDQDNDSYRSNCAASQEGAWWYQACYNASLNGEYLRGQGKEDKGILWGAWKDKYSLKTSIMMMRPRLDRH